MNTFLWIGAVVVQVGAYIFLLYAVNIQANIVRDLSRELNRSVAREAGLIVRLNTKQKETQDGA